MGLAGGNTKHNIEAIALFALLLSFSSFTFFDLTGQVKGGGGGSPPVQLGQWTGFPNPAGTCPASLNPFCSSLGVTPCSVGFLSNTTNNYAGIAGDWCQLFNAPSYWGVIGTVTPGLQVNLEVNCVSPAVHTTGGSVIQLQYANYTRSANLWENTTNFVLVPNFQSIYIDNTSDWDCPGTLVSTAYVSMPSSASTGNAFVFRAVGICGCNSTTPTAGNPIISSVSLLVVQGERRIFMPVLITHGTSTFTYQMVTNIPVTTATTVNVSWLSTNQTTTSCGLLADNCIQSGTTSCSIAIGASACSTTTFTYPTAFTGTVEVQLTTLTSVGASVTLNALTVPLFSTHVIQA